ncbi:hypothetical protein EV174_006113, partial [Coemansia sp. RSA 2320]
MPAHLATSSNNDSNSGSNASLAGSPSYAPPAAPQSGSDALHQPSEIVYIEHKQDTEDDEDDPLRLRGGCLIFDCI